MNKTIGLQLIAYGLLLAGLSYFAHHLAPSIARPTLVAGMLGAALCLIWGLRAVLGKRGKALPILTLIALSYAMLSQTVMTWGSAGQEVAGQGTATLVIAILFVLSVAMLARITYAGVVFDRQGADSTQDGQPKRRQPGKAAS
jgi:hypothetical protein